MESAVGSNPPVLSFLGFLCKGLGRAFGIRNLLPQFLGFLFRANNTSEDKMRKSKIRNWHAESGYPGFLILNARILCIYFCVARLPEGLNFLNQ